VLRQPVEAAPFHRRNPGNGGILHLLFEAQMSKLHIPVTLVTLLQVWLMPQELPYRNVAF
jgi:hypothetical protein